jgi:hypothetical protein
MTTTSPDYGGACEHWADAQLRALCKALKVRMPLGRTKTPEAQARAEALLTLEATDPKLRWSLKR